MEPPLDRRRFPYSPPVRTLLACRRATPADSASQANARDSCGKRKMPNRRPIASLFACFARDLRIADRFKEPQELPQS